MKNPGVRKVFGGPGGIRPRGIVKTFSLYDRRGGEAGGGIYAILPGFYSHSICLDLSSWGATRGSLP